MDFSAERDQLIQTWLKSTRRKFDSWSQITRMLDIEESQLHVCFRHAHDRLGWKSKDALKALGICSGTLYRTSLFMEIPLSKRTGMRSARTVHIEHTVPVAELVRNWKIHRNICTLNYESALAWMLVHSVTTAFHDSESRMPKGRSSKTNAFESNSKEYGLPFMRYAGIPHLEGSVWNVFDEEKIDPFTWSFLDHFSLICRLLEAVNFQKDLVDRLKESALPILQIHEKGKEPQNKDLRNDLEV